MNQLAGVPIMIFNCRVATEKLWLNCTPEGILKVITVQYAVTCSTFTKLLFHLNMSYVHTVCIFFSLIIGKVSDHTIIILYYVDSFRGDLELHELVLCSRSKFHSSLSVKGQRGMYWGTYIIIIIKINYSCQLHSAGLAYNAMQQKAI